MVQPGRGEIGVLDAARVDDALVSRELVPEVTGATIAQEQALKLGSDHAPLHVELGSEIAERGLEVSVGGALLANN